MTSEPQQPIAKYLFVLRTRIPTAAFSALAARHPLLARGIVRRRRSSADADAFVSANVTVFDSRPSESWWSCHERLLGQLAPHVPMIEAAREAGGTWSLDVGVIVPVNHIVAASVRFAPEVAARLASLGLALEISFYASSS